MNITTAEIRKQLNRVKANGWLPHFEEAVAKFTKGYFDVADLIAIASRETNLDPKWLTKAGDKGNGYGLMQADVRSFPQWIKTEKWKDAREGILKGAEILMQKWHDVQTGIGVKRGVHSSKTDKTSYFIGKDVGQGEEAQQVTIAAYNNGRWPHYAVTNGDDPDKYTTGHDYSRDVLGRAKAFRALLHDSAAIPQEAAHDKEAVSTPLEPSDQSQPTNVNIDNAENVNVENKPLPQNHPVTVTVERPSIWAKIGAGIAILTGAGINWQNIVEKKLDAIDGKQLLYVLGGTALIAIALWAYDRAQKRAHEKTLAKVDTAADPSKNTVELREQK